MSRRFAARSFPALAIAIVGLIGALRTFDPMYGDQALFLIGAMKLHAGAVLYRDFWDLKQPGIFGFYVVGGSLFGFTQTGIHVFELFWQLAFALSLIIALRPSLHNKAVAAVGALASVGGYYAGTGAWHLTQVEGLIGFPLLCCLWAAIAALDRQRVDLRLALASGFAAGFVLNWKWLFGAIILTTLLSVTATFIRQHPISTFLRVGAVWVAGLLLPLAAFAVYAVYNGIVPLVESTFFSIPRRLVTERPSAPLHRLIRDAEWFALRFGALVALAATAFRSDEAILVNRSRRAWKRASLAWIASQLVVFLVQRQSWWMYHLLLLLPPLAILATLGLDNVVDHWQSIREGKRRTAWIVAGVATAALAIPLLIGPVVSFSRVSRMRPFTRFALQQYRIHYDIGYAENVEVALSFSAFAKARGNIYVCGDPTIYVLVGRQQGIAINGWLGGLTLREQWDTIGNDIKRLSLPYVFISTECAGIIAAQAPRLEALLSINYMIVAHTREGSWYRIKTQFNNRDIPKSV